MAVELTRSTLDQYAASLQADGSTVILAEGCWWRQVRPFFFRPVAPWTVYSRALPPPNLAARFGGFQYATDNAARTNSHLGFLVYSAAQTYDRARLKRSRRWEINNSLKRFSARGFASPATFAAQAHPIYAEFYRRTRYGFREDRMQFKRFLVWAEQIFADPGSILFGAFDGDELAAIGIVRVIDRTLIYTSFFASRQGLTHHVTSFMLHTIREAAAHQGDIDQIIIGTPKFDESARSVDRFYLDSGCDIRWQPAVLRINPGVRWGLQTLCPRVFAQMKGRKSA